MFIQVFSIFSDVRSSAGGWFPAKVLEVNPKDGPKDSIKVQFLHVKSENGNLEEHTLKKLFVRPRPPNQPYSEWRGIKVGMVVDHLCAS